MVKTKKQIIPRSYQKLVSYIQKNIKKWITVHQTGNTSKGADAEVHANLQSRGNSRAAGWHWQVDDNIAIQSIPHNVSAYQAGSYKGNVESIGVEHCVNSDADYEKVLQNGAELVADIMKKEGIPLSRVVQHNYWSGKNCPTQLRNAKNGISWNDYKKMVQQAFEGKSAVTPSGNSKPSNKPYKGSIVDYLHQQGIKSNFANRSNLAVEYGVVNKESDYKGTAKQNTALLKAMQSGKPKQEGTRKEPIKYGYKGNSIVDYLASINEDNSFSNRKRLASQYRITGYQGTAKQNRQLLKKMRKGSPKSGGNKSLKNVAKEVIDGKWGNNPQRKNKLQKAGYNASKVQAEVNRQLTGGKSKPKKSAAQVADEIFRGKGNWGRGSTRRNRLRKAGYNPNQVQKLVNKKFK